jgi:hypothetical protein
MRITAALLALALFASLLAGEAAHAEEENPRQAYAAELRRIRDTTDCVTKRVIDTLRKQDWNAWCAAHSLYGNTLQQAVTEIETATTRFLFAVLNAGGTLDGPIQQAVNDGANLAGLITKRRVVANAYAALARRGVRYDRRANALALLDRQGVYGSPGPNPCTGGGARTPSAEALENVSPLTGRMPGSPEATEHLRKWQYAWMRESSLRHSLAGKEAEFEALPVNAPSRTEVEMELNELRAEHQQLKDAMVEWRTKYFEAGGR